MNNIKIMTIKLLVISSIAALALGVVNSLTAPKIAELEKKNKIEALTKLTDRGVADPSGETILIDNEDISSYFPVEDSGEVISYILYLKSKGYGGMMTVMASYDLEGSLIDAILMNNQETPGFGKEAEKDGYMNNFKGLGSDKRPLPSYTYEVKNSDVVTGATITFMGISKSLIIGSDFVKGGLKWKFLQKES